jgi:hypothetical protein
MAIWADEAKKIDGYRVAHLVFQGLKDWIASVAQDKAEPLPDDARAQLLAQRSATITSFAAPEMRRIF